jgi:hypothetical protein
MQKGSLKVSRIYARGSHYSFLIILTSLGTIVFQEEYLLNNGTDMVRNEHSRYLRNISSRGLLKIPKRKGLDYLNRKNPKYSKE